MYNHSKIKKVNLKKFHIIIPLSEVYTTQENLIGKNSCRFVYY